MTTKSREVPAVPWVPAGNQVPTRLWVPEAASTAGPDAVALARKAGIPQDPWQETILNGALGETREFRWACNEVCVIVGRQSGKGGIIEARQLAGVFLFDERLLLHSAHQQRTSNDAFNRMHSIALANPDFDKRLVNVARSKGEESLTFRITHDAKASRCEYCTVRDVKSHEAKIRYMARTGGAGRGFTKANVVFLDEAMILDDPPIAALLPTMATMPNWQVWYTASAGDIRLPTQSVVLARVRRRGYRQDPQLMFAEWAAHLRHTAGCVRDCPNGGAIDVRTDPRTWAKTNPAMGIRIDESFLRKMQKSMAAWDFDREFLGVGVYPDPDEGWRVIPKDTWEALRDPTSARNGPWAVGIAAEDNGATTSIVMASLGPGDMWHAEVIERRPGTTWVAEYCKALKAKRPAAFVVHPRGPAAVVIPDLEAAKLNVHKATSLEYESWCSKALQITTESFTLRHLEQSTLDAAVRAVTKHETSRGAFVWEWQDNSDDVSPWIGFTLALGGVIKYGSKKRGRPMVAAG